MMGEIGVTSTRFTARNIISPENPFYWKWYFVGILNKRQISPRVAKFGKIENTRIQASAFFFVVSGTVLLSAVQITVFVTVSVSVGIAIPIAKSISRA